MIEGPKGCKADCAMLSAALRRRLSGVEI